MSDREGIDIVVGDNYRESFPDIMNVLPSEAIKVMRQPDLHETVDIGEDGAQKVNISVRLPGDASQYYLLVLDRVSEDGVRVLHDAFKFYHDLCPDVEGKGPLELLSALADRFGYHVRPGGEAKKLVLRKSFQCAPEKLNTDTIIRLMMPIDMTKGEEVLGTQYLTYNERTQRIEFAIAFVWNVTRYREYLARAS